MKHSVSERDATAARSGEHVPFDARNIAEAPAAPGVYLLYRGHRRIYIGIAAASATIQERLLHHLLGVYLATTAGLLPDCNEDAGR